MSHTVESAAILLAAAQVFETKQAAACWAAYTPQKEESMYSASIAHAHHKGMLRQQPVQEVQGH